MASFIKQMYLYTLKAFMDGSWMYNLNIAPDPILSVRCVLSEDTDIFGSEQVPVRTSTSWWLHTPQRLYIGISPTVFSNPRDSLTVPQRSGRNRITRY
jgi:hypothetical protein